MKRLIYFFGPCASGKTTTRQVFCGPDYDSKATFREDGYKYYYTFYEGGKFACCGTPGSGSDSNTSPTKIRDSMIECAKKSDIVFFDGMLTSPRHIEAAEELFDRVDLVVFDLPAEEIYRRMWMRRKANGHVEDSIPDGMKKNIRSQLKRTEGLMRQWLGKSKFTKPIFVHKFKPEWRPSQCAEYIWTEILGEQAGTRTFRDHEPGTKLPKMPKMASPFRNKKKTEGGMATAEVTAVREEEGLKSREKELQCEKVRDCAINEFFT